MSKNIQNNCNSYSGLYLFGKVIDRTRRHVQCGQLKAGNPLHFDS